MCVREIAQVARHFLWIKKTQDPNIVVTESREPQPAESCTTESCQKIPSAVAPVDRNREGDGPLPHLILDKLEGSDSNSNSDGDLTNKAFPSPSQISPGQTVENVEHSINQNSSDIICTSKLPKLNDEHQPCLKSSDRSPSPIHTSSDSERVLSTEYHSHLESSEETHPSAPVLPDVHDLNLHATNVHFTIQTDSN
jgi:hypothetical protein